MFEVKSGLFKVSRYGTEDQDSPFAWEFETEAEARAFYAELDPMRELESERRTATRCTYAGAFKEIVAWNGGWGETIEREEFR